ncbi:MAG TPA: hypothetical protein VF491_19090 [Vicinamibacterales bacterium]
MSLSVRTLAFCVAALFVATAAHAQVDCITPREQQNAVATAKLAPVRQMLLTIEAIIRKNAAYHQPPEPVRMRTTLSASQSASGGAQIFVRSYPELQGTIQIWTKDRCDVVPQSERVAASIGQVYAFIDYNVQEQFLGINEVPQYQGEYAGYPVYNNWIVMTKDRRLPWIPQTLRDRLDREEQKRQRAVDDWNGAKASLKLPDEAAQIKTYEMFKKTDPAGAEQFLASVRETIEQVKKAKAAEPITDAHLQGHLKALRDYRATFTEAQLNQPAVWMDASGEGRKRLDARIVQLQALTPEEEKQAKALGRATEIRRAHLDKASFQIQDLRADYELANVKPGSKEQAMAFKPDPTFPDFKDPARPQLIMITFWSKSDPKDNSPRTVWLRQAKETFDFPALAALLR